MAAPIIAAAGAGAARAAGGAAVQGGAALGAGGAAAGTGSSSFASRLMAGQLRDRMTEQRQGDGQESGDGSASPNPNELAFLEQEPVSYTQRQPTEAETERRRQRGMTQTAASLSPRGAPTGEEVVAPTPTPGQPTMEQTRGEDGASPEYQLPAGAEQDDMQRMAQLDAMRAEEAQMAILAQQAGAREQGAMRDLQRIEQLNRIRRAWQAMTFTQLAASETIVPIVTLTIQLNVQLANEYFFHSKYIPPLSRIEKAMLVPLNIGCFLVLLVGVVLGFFVILLVWTLTHPWEAFTRAVGWVF